MVLKKIKHLAFLDWKNEKEIERTFKLSSKNWNLMCVKIVAITVPLLTESKKIAWKDYYFEEIKFFKIQETSKGCMPAGWDLPVYV